MDKHNMEKSSLNGLAEVIENTKRLIKDGRITDQFNGDVESYLTQKTKTINNEPVPEGYINRHCRRCRTEFYARTKNTIYCTDCQYYMKLKSNRKAKRKHRKLKKGFNGRNVPYVSPHIVEPNYWKKRLCVSCMPFVYFSSKTRNLGLI